VKELHPHWHALLQAERHAHEAKWLRVLRLPFWYPVSMLYQYALYPLTKREWRKKVRTFFGIPITTALPTGTDILLNGIKSHDSEIRLSKFLTRHLRPGQTFIDIGAHHGYYSLLAASLVGKEGKVLAVEASRHSFDLLEFNTTAHPEINIFHNAAGNERGEIVFYEYPGPYAEYNTTVKGAYEHAAWRKKIKETITRVETVLLDDLLRENGIRNAIIKIDVEGGEYAVLKGMSQSLQTGDFILILEYLFSPDKNNFHHQAVSYLNQNGYSAYRITSEGIPERVDDIDEYLKSQNLDSDNLVFLYLPPTD